MSDIIERERLAWRPDVAANLRRALAQSARGETVDLGSFDRDGDPAPAGDLPARRAQAFANLRAWDEAFEAQHGPLD